MIFFLKKLEKPIPFSSLYEKKNMAQRKIIKNPPKKMQSILAKNRNSSNSTPPKDEEKVCPESGKE